MYKEIRMKILVGYDGSNEAKDALKLAQKHAKAFGAKIEVVKSVTRNHPLNQSLVQETEEKLEREIRNHFNKNNMSYETHLLISSRSAGNSLIWFAELEKIDEIIIGARKRSKVGKLLLGSTAQYVVLHAPCPVITIK
jgi:nucleotide-binding universal stress UspA family protein